MAVTQEACIALMDQLPALGLVKRELRRSGVLTGSAPLGALAVLADYADVAGPMRLTTLAEQLQIDPSVASRQVGHLVEAGAVVRVADPADRRVHRLQVTATGHRMLGRARRQAAGVIAAQLTHWQEGDLMQLVELLGQLRIDLGDRPRGPGHAMTATRPSYGSTDLPGGSLP